ncbi:MAG: cob(I)yrinic acid a,c-diamide adenosyltransferase [Armatimonadota bacterium]
MWYTGRGDEGYTGLFGTDERVPKDSPRTEALGALDEATSALGLARAFAARDETRALLLHIQREIFLILAEVASPHPEKVENPLGQAAVASLEADIDALEAQSVTPRGFIVPGDTKGAAMLDYARAVVRRAERRVVTLVNQGQLGNTYLIAYLNRLSSLLFLLARVDERVAGVEHPSLAKE